MLQKWNDLPGVMRNEEVEKYFRILNKKKKSLISKRAFDLTLASCLLLFASFFMLVVAILIKSDSRGKVFYKQTRVTKNGKLFDIYKFRTMIENADKKGSLVTIDNDQRITKIGKVLRKYRIDEVPQLLNIIKGEMTFVGTRPEVEYYVNQYSKEMYATLLLPAGVTSLASIKFKNEQKLLNSSKGIEKTYVNEILPEKMKYNLKYLENYSFLGDMTIMIETFVAVLKKGD
ncbi:sugar transferase [Carnobacterium divergens]|nr:sugar transferase [Carnobacterium divergens]MDO0875223.1 sugar transferase [Carnobacterium divergens]SUX17575.1 Putative colanic biosynthesis UDP-glucose lipid carrier transferase [Carnobacterium divergens]